MNVELWNPDTFDLQRRQLVPSFGLLYGSAVGAVAMTVPENARILDLGAGDGLLSAELRRALPDAELLLLDPSEQSLGRAMTRFAGDGKTYVQIGDPCDIQGNHSRRFRHRRLFS